ncbi:hypothetical protein D3C80_2240840 [compost metagenome]
MIDVIGHRRADGAEALANRDGDGLTVGQSDDDRATGDRRSHAGGVDNDAAFGRR